MIKKFIKSFLVSILSCEYITSLLYFKITEYRRLRVDEKQKSTLSYHFFGLVQELARLKKKRGL